MGRTLITGGAGYIGMLVAEELLHAGHEVRVLDSLLHGQAAVAGRLRGAGVEVHIGDIRNAAARARALDGAGAGVERFVFASTCSNYGRMADPTVPITEDRPLAPVSLYAEQKVGLERALLALDPAPYA